MKIYFATDHAGFALKNTLIAYVRDELGHTVEDCGAHELDPEDDYPTFISRAAALVAADSENSRAIVLGGSGQGEAMMANRTQGIRAAVYYGGPREIIALSRTHNDANVLSIGARFLEAGDAMAVVKEWLETTFSNEPRHVRRIAALDT